MSFTSHQTRGEVELSSKEDFSDHHKSLSHSETNTQREVTHLIPGTCECTLDHTSSTTLCGVCV